MTGDQARPGNEPDPTPCCAPQRTGDAAPTASEVAPARFGAESNVDHRAALVEVPGGTFAMGADDDEIVAGDGEDPVHVVELPPFRIDATAVTVRRFGDFVRSTGYVTEAERWGWSFVFGGLLPDDFPPARAVAAAPWWRQVHGATWWAPEGPGSSVDERGDHPVVHVSWNDAQAYCHWAGLRLPTEAEWERAARGGLDRLRFPWGDELTEGGTHHCNVWQGSFPAHNTLDDGHLGTAPVTAFEPNGFGLHNVCGNVWEWCSDWFEPGYGAVAPRRSPTGPPDGRVRVIRGGSYLCHASYCNRYRVSARSNNAPDGSTGHMGFRCAADA